MLLRGTALSWLPLPREELRSGGRLLINRINSEKHTQRQMGQGGSRFAPARDYGEEMAWATPGAVTRASPWPGVSCTAGGQRRRS